MKRFSTPLIVAIALTVLSQAFVSEANAQRRRGGIKIGGITIQFPGIWPNPQPNPNPKPNPVARYRVSLYHPQTGGLVFSQIVSSRTQADSLAARLRHRHWKMWKYNGIGEPWHSRAFSNYNSAVRYQPPFNLLGIYRQYVRAGRVTMVRVR